MTISKVREEYFKRVAEVARTAKCERRKSGVIIVLNDEVIGEGAVEPAPGDRPRC